MKVFIFLILSLAAVSADAQVACRLTLSGQVIDSSGEGLPGASVRVIGTNHQQATDERGNYYITGICAGSYDLEVRFVGYVTQVIPVKLKRDSQYNFRLQVEKQLLNEVVVQEQLEHIETTQSTAVLSGKALQDVQGKTLGEVMKEMAGVSSIQTGPAIFKPVIHGVHSQRILILNNGIRQEGQQWGAEHAPEIDPFIASNIVVIKDASAIKYGTDALGGVVVVNPADLPATPGLGGFVHMLGSSNGRSGTVAGMLEGGLSQKGWGWRVQGTGKRSGDFRAADYNLTNTGFREVNFSASAGYHEDKKGFEVFYSLFNTTIGILRGSAVASSEDLALALEREPPQFTESFSYQINEPRQEVTHHLFKLNGHLVKGKNDFRFQYGFQYNDRKEFDLRRGALRVIPALGFRLFTHTLDAEVERAQGEYFNTCIGFNLMVQDNNKIDGTQTIPFIPNLSNLSGGAFWIERFKKGRWELESGLRYDYRFYNIVGFDFGNDIYRDEIAFNNLSGTLGGKVALAEHSSINMSIGTTWRPPNVAELYSLGTHQSAAAIEYGLLLDETTSEVKKLDDVNFANEQAVKWVSTYALSKSVFHAEVSGYVNYIFNYIYLKPRGVTETLRGIFPYFRYTQTDASFVGADISLKYQGIKNIELSSKISLLQAKDETLDDYLIWIPTNRVDFTTRYSQPGKGQWRNWYAELKVRYHARQNRAPRVVTVREINEAKEQGIDLFLNDNRNFDFVSPPTAYALLNVSVGTSLHVRNSQLDFRIGVDNALNTAYREYTNRLRYFADELGRNVTASVKFTF